MSIETIFCLGGNETLARLAIAAGWGYGLRSDYTPYAAPCFVDYPFKRGPELWADHLAKSREWQPEVAAVPDFMHPDQTISIWRQCDELRALGIRPMIIPKFPGAVALAPNDCLIGISVKSRYAGYHYDETLLAGRDVHLLGGDVVKQVPLYRKYTAYGARVVSIDSNTMQDKTQNRGAYFGKTTRNLWRWMDYRPRRDSEELFALSMVNIKCFWDEQSSQEYQQLTIEGRADQPHRGE